MKNQYEQRIDKLLNFVLIALIIIIFASYFEDTFIGFYVLPHFKIQYIAFSIFFMAVLVFKLKKKRLWRIYFVILLLLTLIQGREVLNFSQIESSKLVHDIPEKAKIKILLWNSWTKNDNHSEVYELIMEFNPQITILQEPHPLLESYLRNKLSSYSFYTAGDNLMVVKDDEKVEITSFEEKQLKKVIGGNLNFDWSGNSISLLAVHLSSPTSKKRINYRYDQIKELEEWIRLENSPKILIGDLNTTPWSKEYERLSKLLKDSMKGFGIQSTWPFHNILISLLRIPLDHCFHSEEIITLERNIPESGGSNHKPLLLELGIR